MARKITPKDLALGVARISQEEASFAEHFGGMDHDRFVDQGVSIFRSAGEGGIATVDENATAAVRLLLECLLEPKAPEPFMGAGRTAAAWRMYTSELIRRVAANSEADLREIHAGYADQIDPRLETEVDLDGKKPEDYWVEFRMELAAIIEEATNG